MVYVIGGDLQQAVDYIRRKGLGPGEAIPVDHPERLRELTAPQVVLVGTYIVRPDVQAFDAVLGNVNAQASFGT